VAAEAEYEREIDAMLDKAERKEDR